MNIRDELKSNLSSVSGVNEIKSVVFPGISANFVRVSHNNNYKLAREKNNK